MNARGHFQFTILRYNLYDEFRTIVDKKKKILDWSRIISQKKDIF